MAKDKVLATTDFVGKFHKPGAETVSAEAKLNIWTSKNSNTTDRLRIQCSVVSLIVWFQLKTVLKMPAIRKPRIR